MKKNRPQSALFLGIALVLLLAGTVAAQSSGVFSYRPLPPVSCGQMQTITGELTAVRTQSYPALGLIVTFTINGRDHASVAAWPNVAEAVAELIRTHATVTIVVGCENGVAKLKDFRPM